MRSLSTQINWCRRLQWGLSLGLTIVVMLFVVVGYFPAKKRLDALNGQIVSKTRDVEQNQNKARNLPLLLMEVQELERKVQDYDRQFPRQADFGDFIREITQVSQQFTLRDWKMTPLAPRRGDGFFELPITISFQGDFMNVASFLREVEHLQRLTRIRRLSIRYKDNKTGVVDVEMGLHIYFSEG
jgi:Tfp pilus assembly protein PilO